MTILKIILLLNFFLTSQAEKDEELYIRINQLGYLPEDSKIAVLFSHNTKPETIQLIQSRSDKLIKEIKPKRMEKENWGGFQYWEADFSEVREEGEYFLQSKRSKTKSPVFKIGNNAFSNHQETLLEFMRQQRCGYNPTLDMVCHQKDGRAFFGPMPDSTFVDLSGGWHDAGDQLKYLITSSYATAHMLMAYKMYPDRFEDKVNALGQAMPNGIPDILDEAKWGLDWIHKMHPAPDQLFHQVADDRDHRGFKIPNKDNSDYGWGENSYRVGYFATGRPQGLMQYQSEATGIANLAGRSAAAMALAAKIWEEDLNDPVFAEKCKKAALSLYALGREKEGYQQGNSYSAPYRYNEETWADDMEWAAAELYKLTGEAKYLDQAKHYALMSNTEDSWTVRDSAAHYQLYPFINMGHYSLHEVADEDFKKTLEGYYLDGIKYTLARAERNPFHIGIPFIWCSNNLLTSLVTQVILYEKMSGDKSFEPFLTAQRDWLFGRNPWGTSMFTGIPEDGEYPVEVHTSTYVLLGMEVPGGLVDGPISRYIYNNLIGLTLHNTDKFERVQNERVVYHDDVGDYSTNEPTMDGTAGAILMMTHFSGKR
ncbi:cellulase, Cellulose 1,4-beta-cellobiosidase [Indibacter alkaliphilus LW1]|uniref:Cellulase, Cellulose 1,4-beta-cellobiosidase n=1 Tax=Indibacter alkaliphilus (strain CCUG 57479 / KCTC 22604 / LW1) TaxID=1189612 RepID=S2D1N8_INDAL|nr:glycoside hydrolase family 9 protein [Indibacter alkaliphilus]EOZ93267.1 cellulase, Cellulose 1,4-beta-cellobiosidase [Indibacter alkaliphilus LW1]